MSNFFTKHFGAIALGTVINLPALVKGAIWATDWLARFDFWNTHSRDIPGISAVIGFLTDPPPWTVFITSGAAALIVLWDVRRLAKTPETSAAIDLARKWKLGFFAFCATILTTIWALAWPLYFPAKAAAIPVPASTPTPTPVATPKPPAPPWVTPDEIEQQKKLGRNLLIYSPQNLFSMFEGSEDLSVFLNRWIKIDGKTSTVPVSETFKNKEYYKVGLQLEPVGWNRGAVAASFDPKKWGDALINTRPGGGIRAVCQFTSIDHKQLSPPYTMYLDTIIVRDCELQ
jgi:hypothetical protein